MICDALGIIAATLAKKSNEGCYKKIPQYVK